MVFVLNKFKNNIVDLRTFEQRQTSWRSYKDVNLGVVDFIKRRWSRQQVARIEAALGR